MQKMIISAFLLVNMFTMNAMDSGDKLSKAKKNSAISAPEYQYCCHFGSGVPACSMCYEQRAKKSQPKAINNQEKKLSSSQEIRCP